MTQPFEKIPNPEIPDNHEAIAKFLDETAMRFRYFKSIVSLDLLVPDEIQMDLFAQELVRGAILVNNLLIENGGTPVSYIDELTGIRTSGIVQSCSSFDFEQGNWKMDMIEPGSNQDEITEVTFKPGEFLESYKRSVDISPNKSF